MGTRQRPRPNGTGGLWTIKRKRWNEAKQTFEMVELYVRGREIKDEDLPDGKRKWVTGTGRTPEEAEKRLLTALQKRGYRKGLEVAGSLPKRSEGGMRTEDYLLHWHSQLSPNSLSPTQIIKYRQYLANHVIPHVGHIPIKDLGHRDLANLFEATLPSKRKVVSGVQTEERLMGSNGLLNVYKTLNRALNVAVAERVIDRNPLALVKAPRFEKPKDNIPHYMHIVLKIFGKMQQEQDPLLDHFLLSLLGLRKGERLGLSWKNVSLKGDNPTLIINQQLQRVSGMGLVIKPSTKSGHERRVALVPPFLDLMKKLKEQRKQLEKSPEFQPRPEFADLVFLTPTGKPFDPNTENEMWNEVLRKYKSPIHIRAHATRHIAATYLSNLDVPESVVKSILGHESESMYYFYARQTSKKNRAELQRYGEHLGGEYFSPR